MTLFIGHDLGTSGNKAVVIDIEGNVLAVHIENYDLQHPQRGWAEQDPRNWWNAVSTCTKKVIEKARISSQDVSGIAFAGQMLSLVSLDTNGVPTRPSIIWMDGRAEEQAIRILKSFGGKKIVNLIAGASPSGKDIVPKIIWLSENEPETFKRTACFTDATGYLVFRATGRIRMDHTAAGATGLFDNKSRKWSRLLSKLISFPLDRMPLLVPSTQIAGELTGNAAHDLGLRKSTLVAMGMADIPAAAVGSGAVAPGESHVYLGTSSWIGVTVTRPKYVPKAGIASVPSADPSTFLMIGESETAGACKDWFEQCMGSCPNNESFDDVAARAEPGSRGLLFLPWMFGERSPIQDTRVRGGFVNLSLVHERQHLMRSIYEGIAFNLRWILDANNSVGERCPTLRAIGGGSKSDLWLSILADVTGRPIERVYYPMQAGAIGSALVASIAADKLTNIGETKKLVKVEHRFEPHPTHFEVYQRAYKVFRELHPPLSRAGRLLMEKR